MTTFESVGGSFDFGRVVQRTFKVIGENLAVFALCAVVLISAPSFIGTLLGWKSQVAGNYFSPAALLGMLVGMIGGLILQGLVVHTVVTRLNGRTVSFGDAFAVGARFALPLLGLGILQALGIFVGMILLFVPGLVLAVVWAVSAPALVVEKRGIFESFQRSRDLTRGHRWSIFGLFVVYMILSMIIGAVAGVAGVAAGIGGMRGLAANTMAGLTPMVVVSTLITSLVNGAQSIVIAAGVASIYYELRSTKEGVAPDQLASVFD
jgi:hypothetical protein